MNKAPTQATAYVDGETKQDFNAGANKSVNGATKGAGAGTVTQSIADRKENDFRGSTAQPIRKGIRRKFLDKSENHPRIPKSAYTPVTLETVTPATSMSGGPRAGDENANP